MTTQLKRFLFSYDIESASGHQTFYVDAENLEEAKAKLDDGGGIYSEECEVTDLSYEPDFVGETTLDDFGDFPPAGTSAPDDSAAINRELLEALKQIVALPEHPMRKKGVNIALAAIAKAEGRNL